MVRRKDWTDFRNQHNHVIDCKWDVLYKNIVDILDTIIPVKGLNLGNQDLNGYPVN